MTKIKRSPEIDLIEDALVTWRTRQTRAHESVSLNKFSELLGVSRSLLSMWLLGERPITDAYKKKIAPIIADFEGPKTYEILEVAPPDPDLAALTALWRYIPEGKRQALREQGEKYAAQNQTNSN